MAWRAWREAWQDALYGARGFYRAPEGPAGHFATSAHGLDPTGRVLARAVVALVHRHGLAAVVEVGAGRGELLTAVHAINPAMALTGCDVVDRPAGLPDTIGWLRSPGGATLPEGLAGMQGTLVLAHEWLDVVPCTVAERDAAGRWRQVEVAADGQERLGPPPPVEELDWLNRHVPDPEATRAEVGLARDRAFADLAQRVRHGLVVAVDYGHTRADRPRHGTLTGHRHGTVVAPVPDGTVDLTAHVAVDTLPAGERSRQRDVLTALLGRPDLPPHDLAAREPGRYLQRLQEVTAHRALAGAEGPGGFWWVVQGRGGVVPSLR